MREARGDLAQCAGLVNDALISAAEAGAPPVVIDHLLEAMRWLSSEMEEDEHQI